MERGQLVFFSMLHLRSLSWINFSQLCMRRRKKNQFGYEYKKFLKKKEKDGCVDDHAKSPACRHQYVIGIFSLRSSFIDCHTLHTKIIKLIHYFLPTNSVWVSALSTNVMFLHKYNKSMWYHLVFSLLFSVYYFFSFFVLCYYYFHTLFFYIIRSAIWNVEKYETSVAKRKRKRNKFSNRDR